MGQWRCSGIGNDFLMGTGFYFGGENALEIGRGDGYTTL